MYFFIPAQLVVYWYFGIIHLVEQLQLEFSAPEFLHLSSPLTAANMAVRELSIYSNEALVMRLSSCVVRSHRVGVEFKRNSQAFWLR